MEVQTRFGWVDFVLPLVRQKLGIAHIREVEGLNDADQVGFHILSVKSHAPWIPHSVRLSHEWWKNKQKRAPLLKEIREGIKSRKHISRLPNAVVAFKMCGRLVLLQNTLRNVNLAVREGEEVDALQGFLTQKVFARRKIPSCWRTSS